MNRKTCLTVLATVVALALSAALVGCTYTVYPPKTPYEGYGPQEKLHLKVALNITDELRKTTCEYSPLGTYRLRIPIGESIAQNAGVLARHTFTEVVDVSNTGEATDGKAEAILTPKFSYFYQTAPTSPWSHSLVSIKVEWTLSRPSGNVIWVDTITGEHTGNMGLDEQAFLKRALKKALANLFWNSQQAMLSSQAIRDFAMKNQAPEMKSNGGQ